MNDAEQYFEKQNQQLGNENGRKHRSWVQRDAVTIGDDIESVGELRVDVKTGNEEEEIVEDIFFNIKKKQKNFSSTNKRNSKKSSLAHGSSSEPQG